MTSKNASIKAWFIATLLLADFTKLYAQKKFQPLCRPFRIHMHAENPPEPEIPSAVALNQLDIESLLTSISAVPFHEDFPRLYREAKASGKFPLSVRETKEYLHCVYHYISQDTDQDGIPDWTAIINQQPSAILAPLDQDINGNGVKNIFDPTPFRLQKPSVASKSDKIPDHLKMIDAEPQTSNAQNSSEASRAQLQEQLWQKFRILAVDHTDRHAKVVLSELLNMLESGLPNFHKKGQDNYLVLYAFKGHDTKWNIAAYHQELRAISIAGESAYGTESLNHTSRINLIASLAHELGHDFIFSHLNAQILKEVGERFGGWKIPQPKDYSAMTLYDPGFLSPYDQEHGLNILAHDASRNRDFNFASQYAFTNIHEWFADAFAAWMLQKLGSKGLLGDNWSSSLVNVPREKTEYWVNYQNISSQFVEWMDHKVVSIDSP